YGGYCLPKDTKQLKASFRDVPENLITAVVQSNKTRKDYIAGAILAKQPSVVGIYRLIMKSDSDNFRSSAVKGVMERLDNYGKEIVIYEPTIECDTFMGYRVIKSLDEFKNISDIVVANRMHDDLRDIQEKLYTRDLFGRE
ncbi:TPA: UDP-glucose 6-dehydrogenase, partial [Streptococcus pneumoniae]|nr:UDP-glucose 6-dehydrogenase [Streptococcus pneumoniae]